MRYRWLVLGLFVALIWAHRIVRLRLYARGNHLTLIAFIGYWDGDIHLHHPAAPKRD